MTFLAVVATISFLGLAAIARTPSVLSIDDAADDAAQSARHPVLEMPMLALTLLSSDWVLAALSVLGWLDLRRRGHPMAHYAPTVLVGPFAIDLLSKWLVSGVRARVTQYGFPSGHALGATIFFGVLAYACGTWEVPRVWRWIWIVVSGVLVLGVAYSRLYLMAHRLSDVLGGLTGGSAYLVWAFVAIKRLRSPSRVTGAGP